MQCPINEKELPHTTDTSGYKLLKLKTETPVKQKFKLIIVGNSNAGKSTILHRFCKDVYIDTIKDTSGTRFILKLKEYVRYIIIV